MKTRINLNTLTNTILWSVFSFISFRLALVILNAFHKSGNYSDFISLHQVLYPIFSAGFQLSRFFIMILTLYWMILAKKQLQGFLTQKKRYKRLLITLSALFSLYFFYFYYNYNYASDWYDANAVLIMGLVTAYFIFTQLFQIFKSSSLIPKSKAVIYSPFRFKTILGLWILSRLLSRLAYIHTDDYFSLAETLLIYGIQIIVLFLFAQLIYQYTGMIYLLSSGHNPQKKS